MLSLEQEIKRVKEWSGGRISGRVTHLIGMVIESTPFSATLGEIAHIFDREKRAIPCQVVGFKENKVLLMALGDMSMIFSGAEVYPTGEVQRVGVCPDLCGRILDALGNPIDGKGPLATTHSLPVMAPPPHPLKREKIREPLYTGIKAIDGLLLMGKGQRMGIFSGSGVGKSSLMGMIAKSAKSDINVIALIGERSREVREFIEGELGLEGLRRSVVIVATSSEPAALRSKGAYLATAIAEYFRNMGKDVLLMMDSITRYAMALREIGLAAGEPPTSKGYPPSVFASLPCLLERAGTGERGSITGIYTVLAEADDIHDPIVDQMRSLVDGHIFLSRTLSNAHHFPPIDLLNSLSRVMVKLALPEQEKMASLLRNLMQIYKEAEELITIGAYVAGSNSKIDLAIKKMDEIQNFLKQRPDESFGIDEILRQMKRVLI